VDQHWFASLEEARQTIEFWRIDYNEGRLHTAWTTRHQPPTERHRPVIREAKKPASIMIGPVFG